jgi:hypothetical protein
MALTVTHSTVVVVPDDGTSPVGTDEWNDDHAITGTVGPDVGARELLTANRTYYVRTDGSDSNTGLANTAGGAWLTLQHAMDTIAATIDMAGFEVVISIGAGTFDGLYVKPCVGGFVQFVGSGVASTTVGPETGVGLGCFLSATADFSVNEMTIDPGATYAGIYLYGICTCFLGTLDQQSGDLGFTNSNGSWCIYIESLSNLAIGNATIDVSGTWDMCFYLGGACNVLDFAAWTMTGTPSFATAFIFNNAGRYIRGDSTFTGAATGQRYIVDVNAAINTLGAGANFFPGDIAGAETNGGVYV